VTKYQSQAGSSMADTYDTVGSKLDLDEINASQGVSIVENLGDRTMAERINTVLLGDSSDPTAASTDFNVNILGSTAVPGFDAVTRVLGCSVFVAAADASKVENWSLYVRDHTIGREMAIMAWDLADDGERRCVWNNDGGGAEDFLNLKPASHMIPTLLTRTGVSRVLPQLMFRGTMAAFGAGTVEAFIVVQLARAITAAPAPGEPSSHGLPLPSW